MYTAFIGRPGLPELLIILVVLLLLFGAKRLPGLARSIGQSINEFKKGHSEIDNDPIEDPGDDETPPSEKKDENRE